IWNLADGKLVKSIVFPQPLQVLALSPDGKMLVAVAGHGGGFTIYDLISGATAKQQPEVKKSTPQEFNPNPAMIDVIGFTPDGKKYFAGSFISAGLYFYTVADGKQAARLKLDGFSKGSFNQDGSKLAWGSWNTQPSAKNAITITNTKTGAALQQIPSATMTLFTALSPDGNTLFVLPQGGGSAVLYKLGAKAGR
ncbi:MAG TPA: WD40 repeat domain-containing protein, partial [Chthoniobacteraceae bacterium]|nr:WD40 repeat domain-containing protein [Chthoniobacteraceae bacterium]